jgi:hypothetical protein
VWSAHVAADPPGVAWNGGETSDPGEAASASEDARVPAGAGNELRAECGAHARHAQNDLGVAVLAESGRDLRIDVGDLIVQS